MPFNWSKVAYQSIFNLYFPDDYWCWLLFKVSFDHLYPYFEKFISPLINYQFCLLAIYVLNFFLILDINILFLIYQCVTPNRKLTFLAIISHYYDICYILFIADV